MTSQRDDPLPQLLNHLFAEQVQAVLQVRQKLQLGRLRLRGAGPQRLHLHEVEGELTSARRRLVSSRRQREPPLLTPSLCLPRRLKGTVPGPRSHHQRHQRSLLCWFLLHLFPEVHSDDRGLLLPQDLRMVNSQVKICREDNPSRVSYDNFFAFCRFQSLILNNIQERSIPIYEFR